MRKLTDEEIDLRVREVSRIVKIGMLMDRYPSELSGGQQQRVAIARTLAPRPKVLFMDEPLSNLDAKLRIEMRSELQRLHIDTGSTFIYVTHDQLEAMTLATKICLMNNGVLQQYDAPLNIYQRPTNLFVADFVGNPSINFIEGKGNQMEDGSIALTIFDGVKVRFVPNESLKLDEWRRKAEAEEKKRLEIEANHKPEKSNKDTIFKYHIAKINEFEDIGIDTTVTDNDFVIGIRPEFLELDNGENGEGVIDGKIYSAMPTGMETIVKVNIGNYLLTGVMFGGILYQIGQDVKLHTSGNDILLFDRKTGRLISQGSLEIVKA